MDMKHLHRRRTGGRWNRREWLAVGTGIFAGHWLGVPAAILAATTVVPGSDFRFCLNTGTIRGQNLKLEEVVRITAEAGYHALEPWIEEVHRFVQQGGALRDLRRRLNDHGLTVEGAIGFPAWAVDDDAQRAKGFEQVKRDLDVLAQLGAIRMAAPPAGIPSGQRIEPQRVAERYRQLLELGDQFGIVPILEFWGRNPTIGKLGTALGIAAESGHPRACVLADVFHMYRGGSPFSGLQLCSPQALPMLHLNDYPADPPIDQINDSHRIYPGDGIAPLADILRGCRAQGAARMLSLELFNRNLWKLEALEVARTGLSKMKAAVGRSLAAESTGESRERK